LEKEDSFLKWEVQKTKLPRKGILMVVKITRSGGAQARAIASPSTLDAADRPLEELSKRVADIVQGFRSRPVTPQRFLELENALQAAAAEACRHVLEQETNRLEPDDKSALPSKVRYHKETYRINKKTPAKIATRFGPITLRSFYYLAAEDGEPGLHPLHVRLGIGAGAATPALLERVARMSVDHTQSEVRAWLEREHGLKWSNDRLRKALAGFRQALLPFVADLQKARLLALLEQAAQSRGRHRPVLAVGRDGIMVPMRQSGYREASTATLSVYDRRRRRLGTIYLGQLPEEKQTTLSHNLTDLLRATLTAWQGPLPRLAYITDKGSAPDDYYRRVLKKMKHPRDGKLLPWEWVLDFYHVCSYVGKLADALFGPETPAGTQWFAKMRRWLRERWQGAAQVLRSAMQYLDRRKMTRPQKTEFWKAYRYVRRHRRLMDYREYRRRGLPIGSGVTEAACKTVFTQRFKRSGMRWEHESGQVILDLRVIQLSGIWDAAFAADLAARELPQPLGSSTRRAQAGSPQAAMRPFARLAA
jgi:hypothetical protein